MEEQTFKLDIANASGVYSSDRTIANGDSYLVDGSGSSGLVVNPGEFSWPNLSITIQQPRTYLWKPRKNIKVYELALCLPFLLSRDSAGIEDLPKKARRHFELVVDDEDR